MTRAGALLLSAAVVSIAYASGARTVRVVWQGPNVTLTGGPSQDGRFLSAVDPVTGNLIIHEIATGVQRALTANRAGSKEFAYFSAISPDSRLVSYAWFNSEGFYDLRVVNIDGSGQRVLYKNEQAGFVQPCAWSPDGKMILTLFFRKDNISQIALVPLEAGPPKILRSLNWVYPKRMDMSPDGRSLLYDSFASGDGGDRSIFLLAADGSRERKLIDAPGNHLFPLWTPDGEAIVYATDRSQSMDVMILKVVDGKPSGEPRVMLADAGRVLPMGITRDGDYFFGVRSGEKDVFITDLDNPVKQARRATLKFPGRNTAPAWSPDGNSLAHLSRRGSENFGQEARSIVIRSLASDEERELLPKLAHLERVRWSPDGRSLLVSGSDNKGRGGLFSVDVNSAAVTPVIAEPGASFRGFEGVWSKDGKSVIYLSGGSEIRLREIAGGREIVLHTGTGLRCLTMSPNGRMVAAFDGDGSISIVPVDGGDKRSLPFKNGNELHWGEQLLAGSGSDIWEIPLNSGTPRKLDMPGNRQAGFSLHPDGKRIALTAGRIAAEVRAMRISGR